MSGGFFRGTSADQDTRFSNKQAKLLKTQKFAPELEHLVDIAKVKMDVIKPWIAKRVCELIGFEDEVLINFIYGLLEGKVINGKEIQIQLTGFMEKNTGKFMKELWALLISAQKNASGVPQQFLDAKEEETRKKKVETDRIFDEIQRRKEKEFKEYEDEKATKMDGGLDNISAEESNRRTGKGFDGHSGDENGAGVTNGFRGTKRHSKPGHSSDCSTPTDRGVQSRSNSKAYSNSRSHSKERSMSRSPRARRGSVSPEVHRSPRKRSVSPRRSPGRESISPSSRRRFHSRRRSSPRTRYRSPSPLRRRVLSPARRRSPSPFQRRSPYRGRRRSPSPRYRSPLRRRSPSPWRRRSPSLRRRSPSPWRRRRSPSPRRRRSPSPICRRRGGASSSSSRSRSPVQRRPVSPVRHRFESPVRRRSPPCAVRRRSPSFGRRSPSPWGRQSRSPPQRRSSSPVRRRPPVAVRRRSPTASPSLSRSRSPDGGSSVSPIRRVSVSPVKLKSPRVQKSLRGSPREKTRNCERARMDFRQPISLSSQRDHANVNQGRRKVPSVSPSPEKSPRDLASPSPQTRTRSAREDTRLPSPYESPGKGGRVKRTVDGSRRSPATLKPHRTRHGSPVRSDDGLQNLREIEQSKRSAEKASVRLSVGKNRESPDGPSSGRHHRGSDLRLDTEIRREELRLEDAQASKKSSRKSSLLNEGPAVQYPGDSSKLDEKRSSRLKDARDNNRSDLLVDSRPKIERTSPEESDQQRAEVVERKRKHKRSSRHEAVSDDDSSSDSEVEDRKEAKKRRKEEKKLRKEERRRRREERRRRKDEKRASKRSRRKSKDSDISSSETDENKKVTKALNGEHGSKKKYSSEEGEEAESQKKRLEIELRAKALESLKAKKGISH